jgi:hypothetical protein
MERAVEATATATAASAVDHARYICGVCGKHGSADEPTHLTSECPARASGIPPPNDYICKRCNQAGGIDGASHWTHHCREAPPDARAAEAGGVLSCAIM